MSKNTTTTVAGMTQGPWRLRGPNEPCHIEASDGRSVAQATWPGCSKQMAANAAAIAAVPDLIHACVLLEAAYQRGAADGGSMEWDDVDQAWVAARAAMRKVRGGRR